MGGVLALDLATVTGWAVGPLPRRPLTLLEATVRKPPQPLSGIQRIARPGTNVGKFLSNYADWLELMIEEHKPQGLIFEAPILPAHGNMVSTRKLVGLAGVTEMVAHDMGIRWVREGYPSQIKLHICGFGGPGKDGVKAAIRARGWSFADDNEADALALHDYAGHLFAQERAA